MGHEQAPWPASRIKSPVGLYAKLEFGVGGETDSVAEAGFDEQVALYRVVRRGPTRPNLWRRLTGGAPVAFVVTVIPPEDRNTVATDTKLIKARTIFIVELAVVELSWVSDCP
jgi:hypothetical protein